MMLSRRTRTFIFNSAALCIAVSALYALLPYRSVEAGAGGLDAAFGVGGKVMTHFNGNDVGSAIAIQPDGKILVVGSTSSVTPPDFAVARYDPGGAVDPSFDGDGKVVTDILGFLDFAEAVAVQPDGKIVVAGQATTSFQGGGRFALVRYNGNGGLDTTFGTGGKVTTAFAGHEAGARDLLIQPDGTILVVGTAQSPTGGVALARYKADGSLDTTFGTGGSGQTVIPINGRGGTAESVILLADGNILIGGTASQAGRFDEDIMAARFTATGQLDTTFGVNGVALTDMSGGDDDGAYDIAVQADGKIVAAGYAVLNGDLGMVRYNANGTLDTTFGAGGRVITDIGGEFARGWAVFIQPDNKIVVPGEVSLSGGSSYDFAIWRYNIDGSLDTGFGPNGRVTAGFGTNSFDRVRAAAVQPDGKIILAGLTAVGAGDTDFALARFLLNGGPSVAFDYDADGRADVSIFRESLGDWYLQGSTAGFSAYRFGFATDRIVPADYDGDRRTDIAVYRPSLGTWFILNTQNLTVSSVQFGLADDLPTPADFDGDGKADIGIYRPSNGTWFRNNSSNGQFVAFPFGLAGDKPVPQDFDGDGKADYGVFRPSNGIWFQQLSATNTFYGEGFGAVGDQIVPGDYDGDRKADLAVYRAPIGTWFIKSSISGNFTATAFGNATDQPAAADYDGDGRFDICVFRASEGQWYRLNSSNGQFNAFPFGLPGDRPTHSAFY